MIDRDHARLMAQYNQWMNVKLYDAAASLSDAQRKEDRGAFFKSLHGTLNHLLFADTAWLYRFVGKSLDSLNPGSGEFDDFEVLRARRIALDAEILAWTETITQDWLAADFSYYSFFMGKGYTRPAWVLVAHMFNHETHHRGQAATLLSQAGVDIGVTDLPGLPVFG